MQNEVVIVCKCPLCRKTYKQTVAHKWGGKTYRPRMYEPALQALCDINGQGQGRQAWAGLAMCCDCSIRQAPPSMRLVLEKWLRHGEEECPSSLPGR